MARRRVRLLLVLTLGAAFSACKSVADVPGDFFAALTGKSPEKTASALDFARGETMRFADRIVAQVDAAAFTFASRDGTPEGAERALIWRINTSERAFQTAAQPRTLGSLADLLAMCAYEQKLHEIHWSTKYGDAVKPMLEVWSMLVIQGLETVDRCLPPKQAKAVRRALDRWRDGAVDRDDLLRSGAPRFEDLFAKDVADEGSASLLGLIGLDPLDSLEPAARELARTRELGERAVFLGQRMPRTLAWRTELLSLRMARQPEIQKVLDSVERVSSTAETAVATVGDLPERLREESTALIERVSTEFSAQRKEVVADIERTAEPANAVLSQAEKTLDAATRTVQALDVTTQTVDKFVARFDDGKDETPAEPDRPRGKPFDPVEYTQLAAQVTTGLQALESTTASVDRSLPGMQRSFGETADRVDRTIAYAWKLAVALVLITVAAISAAVLLVRAMSRRSGRSPTA